MKEGVMRRLDRMERMERMIWKPHELMLYEVTTTTTTIRMKTTKIYSTYLYSLLYLTFYSTLQSLVTYLLQISCT